MSPRRAEMPRWAKMAPRSPKTVQEASKTAQEAFKKSSRKSAEVETCDFDRFLKDCIVCSFSAFRRSKTTQDAKTPPRWPLRVPTRPLRWPPDGPRCPHDDLKRASKRSRRPPRCPRWPPRRP
eukprot:6496100-Pyramimonas_sp.AAC.1